MNILRILILGILVTLSLSVETAEAGGPRPVAIVYSLKGEATLLETSRRPLRLFDHLPAGTTLEVGPNSRLALAYINGLRYELGGGSRVTLGAKDLTSHTGPVRSLTQFPPFSLLLPLAEDDHPGPSAGAVTIRGERIRGLYPRRGATVLAGETVLRFEPVTGAGEYRIEVQDSRGHVVFETETADSEVRLASGILEPGFRYRWTVSTVDRVGPLARGEAELFTLPRDTAAAREVLRKGIETAGDGDSLALLAGVDQGLGLLAEAQEELRPALLQSPEDTALAEALAELERRLAEVP